MRSQNIEYIAGVDHVRAYASLLVVFHHSFWLIHRKWEPPGLTNDTWITTDNPLWSLAIETHIVVTMFFVLSGFVFSLAGAGRTIRYASFMRNRVLRVFPLYLTLLFFGMAVFPERVNWPGFVSSATFMGNSLAALNLWPVSTTFWTVAIELQFYVIFPFLNTFLNREGAKPLIFLLLFAIGLRLVGFLIGTTIRDMNYWHLPGRIDAFIFGMLAARVFMNRKLHRMRAIWIVPGLVAFFGCTFTLNRLGGYPAQVWWKALWPTVEAAACTVFVLGYLAAARRFPAFVSRALAYLGELSFSTYLVHFMVMQGLYDHGLIFNFHDRFGFSAMQDAAANTFLVIMPATLLLSFLAYNGIEAPFMRLRGRYTGKDKAPDKAPDKEAAKPPDTPAAKPPDKPPDEAAAKPADEPPAPETDSPAAEKPDDA